MIIVMQQSIAGNADPRYGLADFSFRPREVVDLDDTLAAAWIEAGIAVAQEDFAASIPITQGNTPVEAAIPSETGILNMAMDAATDSIVALQDKSLTSQAGDTLQIDDETMTITDVSDPNNLQVTRAAAGSTIAMHAVGTPVEIFGSVIIDAPPAIPSETGILTVPMNASTDTTVALQDQPLTAASGDTLQIDEETMTVTDVRDPLNLQVARAADGSIGVHLAGAEVLIFGSATSGAQAQSAPHSQTKKKTGRARR